MKSKQLFWGILFLVFGGLLLLNNFNLINVSFYNLWKFWPAILILFGISLFMKDPKLKNVFSSLAAVFLAVVIFAWFLRFSGCHHFNYDDSEIATKEIAEPYSPTILKANLNLDIGAGKFTIEDTTDQLLEGKVKSGWGDYSIERWHDESTENLKLRLKDGHKISLGKVFKGNKLNLKLNPNPEWNFDFDMGAADIDFNFEKYKVKNLKVDMGAASLKLKISELQDTSNITIDGGASSIRIYIPKNSGCEINSDMGLSSKEYEEFVNVGEDTYRTVNYETAEKKIFISLDGGVSSVKVKRY
ncbi:MAG: hypothetical protein FJ213_06095 [Ignavibacteria bacterium]|nr:hypothetical protein [Ignavibacteria bacterium]